MDEQWFPFCDEGCGRLAVPMEKDEAQIVARDHNKNRKHLTGVERAFSAEGKQKKGEPPLVEKEGLDAFF